MQGEPRLVEGVADVVVEFLVLVGGDVLLGQRPQRRCGVEGGRVVAFAEHDREADVVGVGLDDLAQPALFHELVGIGVEVQGHRGAAPGALRRLDAEDALAVRRPQPAVILAGLAGQDVDPVGDHEGRVEPHAELADQGQVLLGIAAQPRQEGLRSGAGDGAERLDQLVVVEADAVVDDRERARRPVDDQPDLEVRLALHQPLVGQRRVAQPVAGVRRVGNQLAEEDLLMGVERMRDDIEQPPDFGLERERFLGHSSASSASC